MGRVRTNSSPSKKHRITDGGEDRISNLPECVLSHILSRMPTKDAVRTSVLSKEWEYKWTSIYNIDLEDSSYSKEKVARFVSFVDRVLYFTSNSQIKRFRLSYKKIYDNDRITTWISVLLWRKVQTLEILRKRYESFGMPLPRRLHTSTFLTELKLDVTCILRVASYNCFPYIKCLKLFDGVEIVNEQSPETGELSFNFPVLKQFQIRRCGWSNVKSVKINAPEMTIFQIGPSDSDLLFVISANKLENFEVYGWMDNIILTAPSVNYAKFCVYYEGYSLGSKALVVLNGFLGLKYLQISGYLVQILKFMRMRSETGPFPVFNSLQHFHICDCVTGTALWELLGALPSVKVLTLSIDQGRPCDHNLFHCNDGEVVEPLASCVLSNLREVRIRDFEGRNCQIHHAKLLLENAENLKKMFVHIRESKPTMRMAEVERIFSAIPRRSTGVSVEVIDVVKKKKRVR